MGLGVALAILGGGLLLLMSGSDSSSEERDEHGNKIKDLRKKPGQFDPNKPPYGWVLNTGFLNDAELNGYLYRIHDTGILTKLNKEIKVETMCNRSVHCKWGIDSIFFESNGYLYLGNERQRQYNKYHPTIDCWTTIGDWEFKSLLDRKLNEQRQQEQGV